MTFNNPMEAVYKAYLLSREGLFAVERIASENSDLPISWAGMLSTERKDMGAALVSATRQADDLAVFALLATFERYVIERLQMANERLASGHPSGYSRKLAEKFKAEVEYWRFDEILDLFKPELDVDLVGRVKQIKRYRDWIAHRNSNKTPPSQAAPGAVFEVLSKVAIEIDQTHAFPSTVHRDAATNQRSRINVCRDPSPVHLQA
ncbi:hypothetical protein [Pandoraea oxalativorans]|uniref:Uncharacterized protein n=1 Tax=Pandoraea oxalativorans TaxID=573737 RepID=A0A0E3YCD7_9BURK|nr:hypothetical protein [Pandoraea oxalativorans]AKC69727.1 hypothetical protein MB84_09905 [Pandoraea oxalativorans]